MQDGSAHNGLNAETMCADEGVRKYFEPKDSDERQIADRRRGHTASADGLNGMVLSPTTVGFGGQPVSVSGGSKGDLLSSASNTQPAHEATVHITKQGSSIHARHSMVQLSVVQYKAQYGSAQCSSIQSTIYPW
jgi:hypothetical protein